MKQNVLKTLSRQTDSGTIVELVENEEGHRFVVKRIQNLEAPIYRTIFQKETQALLRLKACSNIVRIYRSDIQPTSNGHTEGIISMEYIPGHPLSQVLDIIPNISTRYYLVKQLTNAIRHAHQNSVIHRDINPSNILITESFELKLIDFGIAKIRGMFQVGTTYQFATPNYSAPEVAIHSENATERSDIYSLGAVIYYLFTGNTPPIATDISSAIESTGGMDIELKKVLQKMCAAAPNDRYENIDDCELALSPLYQRYCGSDERYYFSVPTEVLEQMRHQNLVRRKAGYPELLESILPSQFSGSLARTSPGEQHIYVFDGISISMQCIWVNGYFRVVSFRRLDAYKREQHKRFSIEVSGSFWFIPAHKISYTSLPNNYSEILTNRIDDFQADIRSQKNIDREYDAQYGIWRQFIQAMVTDASQNAVRLYYTNIRSQDGILLFKLEEGSVPDEAFSQDTLFIFEQPGRQGKKSRLLDVGSFLEYRDDGWMAVKASPRKSELPSKGSICLDYRKEIQQYRRQEAALEDFRRSETANSGNLKGIFVGVEQPGYFQLRSDLQYYDKQLDFTQKRAVKKVLEADDIALIQGPPGTGKTNVLVEVIRQILGENSRNPAVDQKILIVSQSHAAVDKILEDLSPFLNHITTIRIGHEKDLAPRINEQFGLEHCQALWVNESVEKCTQWLSQRLDLRHIPLSSFLKYAQILEELKVGNLASSDRDRLEQAAARFEETYGKTRTDPYIQGCLAAEQWARRLGESGELGEYYIKDATVVAGTCIGVISDPYVRDTVFDYVIVDEAAKATLPEIMVPLVRAHKAILVGDHKQLPPVFDREVLAKSFEISQIISELQNTGFGKLFDLLPDRCKETLSTQYRMHPAIGDLISLLFYDGKVQNGVSKSERSIDLPMLNGHAITWLTTSNAGKARFEQPAGHNNKGFINHLEVTAIQLCLQQLDQEISACGASYSIGVITPYRAQLELIRNRLKQMPLAHIKVDINTVDAFQGSQRDIIIYSTVRSSTRRRIGFLKEEARLNVSFSRAKRALIIVGDGNFLSDSGIPGNRFPFVRRYMQAHPEDCQELDVKELSNAI